MSPNPYAGPRPSAEPAGAPGEPHKRRNHRPARSNGAFVMRIAFLGDGSLNHVRRWIGYFRERGHEVLLLSFEQTGGCGFPAVRFKKHLPTNLLGYLSSLRPVKRALRSFRPDLVNAIYVSGYGFIGALSGFRPLVVSALGSDLLVDYPGSPVHRAQISYALRKADLVTTDADNLSEMVVSIGAPAGRVVKVYLGIDGSVFHPPATSYRERGETPGVISTRKLHPVYNLGLLVDAAPMIIERRKAEFVICGDGPERRGIEKRVSGLGLRESFHFRGELGAPGVAHELGRAAVYVSTSRSDSTSVSLLEAMACGLPPAVTDLPANREWIENGVNGLLFKPDDPHGLASSVVRFLEDEAFVSSVRERNIRIVKERGLWDSNMEAVERAFQETVSRWGVGVDG